MTPLCCSFCGAAQSLGQCRALVMGPAVSICDRCVQLCVDGLAEQFNIAIAVSPDIAEAKAKKRAAEKPEARERSTS